MGGVVLLQLYTVRAVHSATREHLYTRTRTTFEHTFCELNLIRKCNAQWCRHRVIIRSWSDCTERVYSLYHYEYIGLYSYTRTYVCPLKIHCRVRLLTVERTLTAQARSIRNAISSRASGAYSCEAGMRLAMEACWKWAGSEELVFAVEASCLLLFCLLSNIQPFNYH